MAKRDVSRKTRFEVFKRDSFTCQYCGGTAPDVILQLDHVKPIAKSGSNRMTNLVTSCQPCNSGKSDRELSDSSAVDVSRRRAEESQERKNQIAMMLEWQESLVDEHDFEVQACEQLFTKMSSWSLADTGRTGIRKLIKKFGFASVLRAIPRACNSYVDDSKSQDSANLCLSKLGGVCRLEQLDAEQPLLKDAYYVRGIIRNRLDYINEKGLIREIVESMERNGASTVRSWALEVRSWSQFRNLMDTDCDG